MTTDSAKPNQVKQAAGLLMLVVIALVYYFRFREAPKMEGEVLRTTAVITKVGKKGMRGLDEPTIFTYQINGKEYEGSFKVPLPCLSVEKVAAHTYQVVCNKDNPAEARLLVTEELFKAYEIPLDEESKAFYDKFWVCKG